MSKTRSTITTLAVGALTVAHPPAAAFAESVGTAAAANTRSVGTPAGGSQRIIHIGEQIVRDERIETSATGSLQVIFIDKTALSIGPNSTLVIDKFVYNPATSTGALALTLGRGVLRVVGGQATHTTGGTITTPAATIGIRGGIATISHCIESHGLASLFASLCDPPGTHVVLHFGVMQVTSGGVTQTIQRPGFGVTVTQAGAPPTTPFRFSQAEINSATALLSSRFGQRGGTHRTPTDTGAAAYLGRYFQGGPATPPFRPGPDYGPNGPVGTTLHQGVGSAAAGATPPPCMPGPYAHC